MISAEDRKTILVLSEAGESNRSIARKIGIDRKTVSAIISSPEITPLNSSESSIKIDEGLLREVHASCGGWIQRTHEVLSENEGIEISYSALTKRCRDLGLSRRQQAKTKRFEHVDMEPGEEMQHDTSPYNIYFGEVRTAVVASVIYLRYSKRFYLKFYLSFKRYQMKCFIHEALTHFGGSAKTCIIDNTNLARHAGAGYSALISSEMEYFSRRYGFEFICHEIKHSNRKAGNERAFWTTETNFLPGRTFKNLDDMNAQAFEWATVRMYRKPNSKTRLIPAETFVYEKPWLEPLIEHMPAPTQPHSRKIDRYGYIPFQGNHYWVPGKDRFDVKVIEFPTMIRITRSLETLVEYSKASQDVRGESFKPDGVVTEKRLSTRHSSIEREKESLNGKGGSTPEYVTFILSEAKGVRKMNFIRSLHSFSKHVSDDLFEKTVARALHYRIIDMDVVESIASRTLGLVIPADIDTSVDDELMDRLSYRDGSISEEPDLNQYQLPAEEDESC
jgi:transposase